MNQPISEQMITFERREVCQHMTSTPTSLYHSHPEIQPKLCHHFQNCANTSKQNTA